MAPPSAPSPWAGAAFRWLGRLPVAEALSANAAAVADLRAGGPAAVLGFEPAAPVFTLGRRAATPAGRAILAPTLAACAHRGVQVVAVDRGGLGTLHLPGQTVLFLALPCRREQLRALVAELLRAAAQVAQDCGVAASIGEDDQVGLWSAELKIASIGLSESGGIVSHGLALNSCIDARVALGLTLCGRSQGGLGSLRALTLSAADCSPPVLGASLARALALSFGPP